MFTGIVGGIGRIVQVRNLGHASTHGLRIVVEAPRGFLDDAGVGDSISVNGACMTVAELDSAAQRFLVDVSIESLDKTAGLDAVGPVNLEKSLRAGDRLGGHLVSGHVDGVGVVTRFEPVGESRELRIRADASFARFLATKGSIAVNGASLTVNRVVDSLEEPPGPGCAQPAPRGGQGILGRPGDSLGACEFSINLIPHTLQATTLGALQVGQRVNLEVDLIARYVERMLSVPTASR